MPLEWESPRLFPKATADAADEEKEGRHTEQVRADDSASTPIHSSCKFRKVTVSDSRGYVGVFRRPDALASVCLCALHHPHGETAASSA